MGSNKMFTICVQFKWGRTGTYSSDVGFEVGNCVIVAVEGGIDLGMVAGSNVVNGSDIGSNVPVEGCVLRVASADEMQTWKGCLVEKEVAARRLANKILPENTSNVRVLHAEYRFDEKALHLRYSPSGTPNLEPCLPKLYSAFQGVVLRLVEMTPPAPMSLAPAPGPAPVPSYSRASMPAPLKVQRPPAGHAHAREESIDSVLSSMCSSEEYDTGYSVEEYYA